MILAVAAFSIATIGAGRWSLDHAFGLDVEGWWGAAIAATVGVVGAALQLAVCYRRHLRRRHRAVHDGYPPRSAPSAAEAVRVLLVVVVLGLGGHVGLRAVHRQGVLPEPARGPDVGRASRAGVRGRRAEDRRPPDARSFADVEPIEEALRQRADVAEQATDLLAGQLDGASGAARRRPVRRTGGARRLVRRLGQLPARPRGPHRGLAGGPTTCLRRDSGRHRRARSATAWTRFADPNGMPSCVVPGDFG